MNEKFFSLNREETMDFVILCEMLELPGKVKDQMLAYKRERQSVLDKHLIEQLKKRECWDETISEIKERIGEDANGFFILSELLTYSCSETYKRYRELEINEDIFIATMKFCTGFINGHKRTYGDYAFTWAWWMPRQVSLQEFRIGELEFEFVDGTKPQISVHIPDDANMEPDCVQETFRKFQNFLERYFPEWVNIDLYCESWMLSPALEQLLPSDSNIIRFKKLFYVESIDYESMAVLDWVYPGAQPDIPSLPERTSLQKKMKQFLLAGGKVGWAKGILIRHPASPLLSK
jgi:hypothetical protein